MKKIFLILLAFSTLIFAAEQRNSLGLGVNISESEYDGVGEKDASFAPMIQYTNGNFYFKGFTTGYNFINEKNIKIGPLLTLQGKSVKDSDSDELEGINERKRTLEAGLNITFKPIPLISLGATGKFDTLSKHKGFSTKIGLAVLIPLNKAFIIRLAVDNTSYSKDFVDYYYGVDSDETTSSRSIYSPSSSSVKSQSITFILNLSKNLGLNASLAQNKYDDEITDSPIVSEDKTQSIFVSLNYKF